MTLIHMETSTAESTLQQIRNGVSELEIYLQELQTARRRLSGAWIGGNAPTEYLQGFERCIKQLDSACTELETLGDRLSLEIREWMDADHSFGGTAATVGTAITTGPTTTGTTTDGLLPQTIESVQEKVCGAMSGDARTRCDLIWSHPPSNAEQLAYMIMNLPPSMPIVIIQIGAGEYLVLMRGTTDGVDEGTNWGSAAESMFGSSSYQNSVLKALQDANLPENATLHFAGHSQGGMIAQNLAVDPRVVDHYNVESVTMFGSPDTIAAANPDVKYVSFEAPGDIVPKLDSIVISVLPDETKDILAPAFRDVTNQADNHIIINSPDAWNPDPNVSHSVYDNPDVLKNYEIPFKATDWKNASTSDSQVSTIGPVIYKGIKGAKDYVEGHLRNVRLF